MSEKGRTIIALPDTKRVSSDVPDFPQPDFLSSINMDRAQALFGSNGELYVDNGEKNLARDAWQKAGMPDSAINSLVDEESRLIFRVPQKTAHEVFSSQPLEAGRKLVQALSPLIEHNIYPLDSSIKGIDGFNAHLPHHVLTVVEGADNIFQQLIQFNLRDITKQTRYVGTLGGAIHDVANIITRKFHATASPFLVARVIPEITHHPDWNRIQQVAVFHNEQEMGMLIDTWGTAGNTEKTIKQMQQLDPAILAILLADKLHIGQDRLPPKWQEAGDPKGLLRDFHVGINAAFDATSASYSPDGTKFSIEMTYNPGLETSYFAQANGLVEPARHPALIDSRHHRHGRLNMPDAIHQYLKDGKASHSEVLEAIMWSEHGYKDRLRLAIMAAFALVPNMDTVEITIRDTQVDGLRNRDRRGKSIFSEEHIAEIQKRTYKFSREHLDEQLEAIQAKFLRKGIDVDALKEASKALQAVAQTTRRTTAA